MAIKRGKVKAMAVIPDKTIYNHTRFMPTRLASEIMNTTTAIATMVKSADKTQSTAEPNHAPT